MTSARGDDPIRGFLAARVSEGWMSGATWSVAAPQGTIDRGAVGSTARDTPSTAVDETTPFDLASLTKPLCTALLLVLLEEEGTIDPTRPVSDWVDELGRSWVGRASLLDLASHTAGLAAWLPLYLGASDLAGYLDRIADTRPAVTTGQTLYSDLGYIVLGVALERAVGQGLDRLFRDRVARPLGLVRLGFAAGGSSYDDAAATERGNQHERQMAGGEGAGHPWRSGILRGEVHDANAHGLRGVAGHAGLFGTAAEVATLGHEILRPRRLALGPTARRRLLEARSACGGRTVGWVTASSSGAARGILPDPAPGHTGFTGTSLWLDPATGRSFVLLTNRVHPTVGPRNFHHVRRAFHRLALRATIGADPAPPLQ